MEDERPTRCCSKCGEYVGEKFVPAPFRSVKKLAHIDADGNIIYRNHPPTEEV